jgi:hypothetical protein
MIQRVALVMVIVATVLLLGRFSATAAPTVPIPAPIYLPLVISSQNIESHDKHDLYSYQIRTTQVI